MSGRRGRTRQRVRRGVYLVPSLFTTANAFCGFFSLVETMRQNYTTAATLIIVAMVADVLDGRIARLTGTTSAFGAAFDSLADLVSFGVAPAMLALSWGLWLRPRLGPAVAFLYLIGGATRLARFNTRAHDPRFFEGLPIPGAAGAVALAVLNAPAPVRDPRPALAACALVAGLAVLMVSTLPYPTFRQIDLRRRWPVTAIFGIATVFALLVFGRARILAGLLVVYLLSAPYLVLARRSRRAPQPAPREEGTSADGPDTTPDLPA